MDAKQLYELVKDTREVWEPIGLMFHYRGDQGETSDWGLDGAGHICPSYVTPDEAELILEALYARATGCGVVDRAGDGREYEAFPFGDYVVTGTGPTRLAALVAAYTPHPPAEAEGETR